MSDIYSQEKRHEIMTNVKSKNTSIEIKVRKWLFSKGFRYRINTSTIQGRPDISNKKYKIAIFINGCFWHGHENCLRSKLPKINIDFWANKIARNKNRDIQVISSLVVKGWNVFTVWGCELTPTRFSITMKELLCEIEKIKKPGNQ